MYPQKYFLSQELSSLVLQSKNLPSDFEAFLLDLKALLFHLGTFISNMYLGEFFRRHGWIILSMEKMFTT